MTAFLAAVVQLSSTSDRVANLASAREWTRNAAALGARAVFLPEMWPFIGADDAKVEGAEDLDGPTVAAMRELARDLGIWLQPGTFAERSPVPGRVYNTAPLIDPDGAVRAVYRKIHLFDVDLPGGAIALESATVTPGERAVVASVPFGTLGLSVCYDLRFAALYQSLRDAGADVLAVPAAFTATTGKDHWEVLLRARAIEQQAWVVAADQSGRHGPTRSSHGHSMIVDPWGHVVARCSDGPGLALALLDPERAARVRALLPCASHRRAFAAPVEADPSSDRGA